MQNWGDLFKDKKITLMGLGLLGRGVGDALFFAQHGAELTVTDLKNEDQLASSVRRLRKFNNIRFVLGRHDLADFQKVGPGSGADMVIKAAGVPINSPFIQEAEKNGVPVLMSTALFAKLTPADVIGVTGTRGKSTVTQMLYEILRAVRTSNTHKAERKNEIFLGGNVLGMSTLSLLPKVRAGDKVVLELDSWQLQGFDGFSPHVAVFTTFMPDHLNYYAGDMKRYFADKARIYEFQTEDDFLIVSKDVAKYIKKYGPKPRGAVIVVDEKDLPRTWKLSVPGLHNRLNAALALAAARALGVDDAVARSALRAYKGLPGRLERVRTYKGADLFNDTNSTTEEAVVAALSSFTSDKKTVLIFGGADKKLKHDALFKILPRYARALILLPGTGTDAIKPLLRKFQVAHPRVPVARVSSMKEAVAEALKYTRRGDRIIMSPGFASFGLFKNEYDRGDQFNAIVKKLS